MKITYKQEIQPGENISEQQIIDALLEGRKIDDTHTFLNPPHPSTIHLSDFGYTNEITTTLNILEKVKKDNKMVVVYTDYDADGITGGSILWETLHLLGFKVMPYVPHRQHEGYGFSVKGIDNVKAQYDPSLIISVDHGIAAREKVEYAKSIGIPIIITDHHLKPELLPDEAKAIFHIPLLSGSGVSYFFSKMVFQHFSKPTDKNHELLTHNFNNDYLSLASIGTIADLVPLVGPSRSVVKHGLDAFARLKRIGLQCIIRESGIEGKKITPYEIGFVIAPRINAIGRLEHAIDALRLLCTTNIDRANQLACKVGETNKERQDLVKEAVEQAKQMVEKRTKNGLPKVITLVSDEWHEGIIGLIASKMVELYYRPTIVMTKVDGFYKGSARSIPSFHITNFLRSFKDRYLVDAGGHTQAAGFTIMEDKVPGFMEIAEKEAGEQIKDEDLVRVIETDIKVPLAKVTMRLAKMLENLNPFGIGNPKPTLFSEAEIIGMQAFGKAKEHLKVYVKDPTQHSFPLELIAFSKAKDAQNLTKGKKTEIVYQPEIDHYGGNEKLRGRLIHIS